MFDEHILEKKYQCNILEHKDSKIYFIYHGIFYLGILLVHFGRHFVF